MAVDKLVDSTQLDADLTSVANAIRTKGGTSAQLAFPAGFVSAVQAIPTGVTPTGTKNISITQNGTTTEDVTNYASAEITANVPNTYAAADEGKVVDNGALVSQTSATYTTNDTYDTTLIDSVTVNVSGGGGTPSGFGDPYTKVIHGVGGYTVSGVDQPVWDTYASGTNNTRRSIWATSGDHEIKRRSGSSTYADGSNLYPVEIPTGATKFTYTQDKTGQAIIFFTYYESGSWHSLANTGWVDLPIQEYTIPSGATHFIVTLRTNSSNSAFAWGTDPYYGEFSFS